MEGLASPHLLLICHMTLVSRALVFSEAEWGSETVGENWPGLGVPCGDNI